MAHLEGIPLLSEATSNLCNALRCYIILFDDSDDDSDSGDNNDNMSVLRAYYFISLRRSYDNDIGTFK